MKLLAFILTLMLCGIVLAQTDFTVAVHGVRGTTTVRELQLPTLRTDQCWVIIDGATDSDCTVGLGSIRNICCSDGTTWLAVGDGAGAGAFDLDFSGDSGSGVITDGETFGLIGGAVGIDTSASGNNLTITFDGSEVNDETWGSNTQASIDWTFDPTGGSSPVLRASDAQFHLDAGTIRLAETGGTDSPTLLFAPATGTTFSLVVDDATDDLGIVTNTGSTESVDYINIGAGVMQVTIDGSLVLGGNDASAGFIDLLEDSDNGSNRIRFIAPASTADRTCILTDADAFIPASCVAGGGGEWTDQGVSLIPNEAGDIWVRLNGDAASNPGAIGWQTDSTGIGFDIAGGALLAADVFLDITGTDTIEWQHTSASTFIFDYINPGAGTSEIRVEAIQDRNGPGTDWSVSAAGAAIFADSLIVTPTAPEAIAAGATITADACGSIKEITAVGAQTTSLVNTFTAPAAANNGCIMEVCNVDAEADIITLDDNALFVPTSAAQVPLSQNECITVGSNGAIWLELNQAGGVVGADHIANLTEIAQGIKTASNDTSNLVVGTAAGSECAEWDGSGNLVGAGAACGSGTGDVSDVGPGCGTGACWTDGLATATTTMWVWEGTVINTEEFTFTVPADPDFDITWVLTQPTGARTQTFPDAGGEFTLLGQEIALTTETSGNYVADVVDTATISNSVAPAEGANASLTVVADSIDATHIDETDSYLWTGTSQFNTGTTSFLNGFTLTDEDAAGFGTANEWTMFYNDAAADQLLIVTTKTAAIALTDPMLQILVGTTPSEDQDVFGVAKGTQATNTDLFVLDEDGDGVFLGTLGASNLSGTNTGDEVAATLTVSGIVELATGAETNTGTDATRAVTPDGLDDWTGSAQVTTLGTIVTGVWNGTSIADGNVDDTITASNYLLLTGGVLTGEVTVDDLGLAFNEGDTLTNCTTFPATGGGIFFDDSEGIFKKCQDNVLSDLDAAAGAHADTIVWSGTAILESGVAFQFGDATDATVTHTYANTGTNVVIAYSSNLMNISTGQFIATTPAPETISAAATITADACGSIKEINSSGNVTTNTTDTFTAPAAANDGCIMEVCNTDSADTITLDDNANFDPATAGDVALSPNECITVGSNATIWLELNQAGGGGADTNAVKTICFDFASLHPIVADDLFGPLEKNAGTNHDIFERAFDDGTDECVAGSFVIPPDADEAGTATLTIWFRGLDITGANAVCWDFKELEIPTAGNVDWDTALVTDALGCTNADASNADEHVRDTTTVTLTSNDWDQNELVFFQVCRDGNNASDDHLGDAYGKQFCIEIPRA